MDLFSLRALNQHAHSPSSLPCSIPFVYAIHSGVLCLPIQILTFGLYVSCGRWSVIWNADNP